jgi:hypothetical protein
LASTLVALVALVASAPRGRALGWSARPYHACDIRSLVWASCMWSRSSRRCGSGSQICRRSTIGR